ncbi:MAG: transporter substrate-binding domain-containing protein, partial [Planctomycetota bacterium]
MLKNATILILLVLYNWTVPSPSKGQSEGPDWLTREEQAWLQQHPRIRVAPTPDYPPFEYWKGRQFQGIVRTYLDHLAQQLDIEFEVVKTQKWEDNLRLLKNREIDAVSLLVPWSDRDYVEVSEPYIEYPAVIIVRNDNQDDLTLRDLVGMRVAVPNDYTGEFFLRRNHPEIEVVEVNGPSDGVRMVSLGTVDAFFGGASVVAFTAEKEGLSNLRIAGVSDFTYSNGFGVRSDWPILARIISKTFNRMTPGQHRSFHSEWVTNDFFRRQYFDSSEFFWTAASVLGLLLTGILLILVWNRRQAKFISQLERAK